MVLPRPRPTFRRPLAALLRPGIAAALAAGTLPAQSIAALLNPTAALHGVRVAQNGIAIHACGCTATGNTAGFIHYARSVDGGRTWPRREVPLAFSHSVSDLAATPDLVVVLVGSQFLGPHTVSSFDGGTTFLPPVRLASVNTPVNAPAGRLHVDGLTVNVVWLETRASGGAIWANRSTDGGLTWQPAETRLDPGIVAPATGGAAEKLELIADGAMLHALWQQTTVNGPQVLHQQSSNGGVTWLPQPRLAAAGSMLAAGGAGNHLFVSRGSPLPDLRSSDGGATWSPLSGVGFLGLGDVAVRGLDVLAVNASSTFAFDLRVNVSRDGGATWRPLPLVLPSPIWITAQAAIAGDALLVHGAFTNNPASGGFVIQTDDYGATWRLLTNDAAIGLCEAPDRLVVTTRPSPSTAQVTAYVLSGHTTLGAGTGGTGGRVPFASGTGLPLLGRAFQLELHDALANAPGVFATSFAPTFPTPFGGATLWLRPPILTHGFVTSGTGAASMSVAVPAAGFAGLVLSSQAFVLDPLGAGGFTSTSALQSWIR